MMVMIIVRTSNTTALGKRLITKKCTDVLHIFPHITTNHTILLIKVNCNNIIIINNFFFYS